MLGKKKKEVILSIESDGRIREFNTMEDAANAYHLQPHAIDEAIGTKERLNRVWFRRKADKIVAKKRIV